MISNPFILLLLFISIVSLVLLSEKTEAGKRFMRYLPVPLWCYFIPTIISTLGWIPADSPFYGQLSRWVLPACLILILVGTELSLIFRLGRQALLAMFLGTIGILIGGVITFVIAFKLGKAGVMAISSENLEAFWKGWACLSASWTGGSANMIAVKESLQAPESLFSNLIIVDTIGAYSWMAFLVFISKYQESIDQRLGIPETAGLSMLDSIEESMEKRTISTSSMIVNRAMLFVFAFSLGYFCWWISDYFPPVGKIFNRFTWTVILATLIPLLLSMTPARKLESIGAGRAGSFLLYLLLASIGARANLGALISAPLFIVLGLLWIILHAIVLLILGRYCKIPVSLLATSSQANVGGTASTPIVAGVYHKELASVGVILAVLGNIYGTAFGLFFAQICKMVKDLL